MVCRRRTRTPSSVTWDRMGDDVSSLEGDNPQVGVRVEHPAETPCL